MPRLRRTQTVYITADPFFSPRGKVLHHFDQFLEGIAESEFPCVWLTSLTRAQLDEPRRRLGQSDPYIGESGCGVYLPEDYFHLKSGKTIRLGRFTCIPVAKPQPAAAEALEDLASELDVAVVPLRSLSQRELSQNTGLPEGDAEHMRMRDFDELFFFAGATDSDIANFANQARLRGLTLQNLGQFWSLSVGADIAKCIRELGALYDRAMRAHLLRVAIAAGNWPSLAEATAADPQIKALSSSCDRTLLLSEKQPAPGVDDEDAEDNYVATGEAPESDAVATRETLTVARPQGIFHLHTPDVWEELLTNILAKP